MDFNTPSQDNKSHGIESAIKPTLPKKPQYVVGIGASAGGLEAIEAFFENMPTNSGMGFVLVQHLSPDFKSLMNEILARHTEMKILRVTNEMIVEPNTIYLIPPKKNMIISNSKLLITDQGSSHGLNLPIDMFFRSLAQDYGKHAIAVVLSGTGSDGSRGICDIHDSGGFVIAQDEESAGFDGMPRSAIKTSIVDLILTPSVMPDAILQYVRNSGKRPDGAPLFPTKANLDIDHVELQDIFELLRLHYSIDFKFYKPSTIDRRIERRIHITHCDNLADYVSYVAQTPTELDNLYHDLLIGVTRFFRDPPAFAILDEKVIPKIFESKGSAQNEIRVWAPGCATGEEAYSLAISFNEYAKANNLNNEIKIFATDIHQNSLEKAAAGIFGQNIEGDITPECLENNFIKKGENYIVSRHIRKMVIFAPQNVMSDPPFTNLDLLVCRNLLIYLDPPIQRKIYSLFHFALNTGGFLFLGPSESLSSVEDEFDTLNNHWKIYTKRRDVRLLNSRPLPIADPSIPKIGRHTKFRQQSLARLESTVTWAYEAMLHKFVKNGFLIDEHTEILHIFGQANDFVNLRGGRMNANLQSMIDEDLGPALSAALHRVKTENITVQFKDVKVNRSETKQLVSLTVTPLRNQRTNKMFYFIDIDIAETQPPNKAEPITVEINSHAIQQIQDLESELEYAKEHLQATNEELEASNEELQAANEELLATNEELQSTNEELQSTNEELQSTNEELHSVNEELHTVNVEYHHKIEELTQLNNDMENLLTNTEIGTVFLDHELRIRKFTPAVTTSINILDRDIGRHFQDIQHKIKISKTKLNDLIQEALKTDASSETEVKCAGDMWMLMRILPYHDENAQIKGIVLTFIDITTTKNTTSRLKNYTAKLQSSESELENLASLVSNDISTPLQEIANFLDKLGDSKSMNANNEIRKQWDNINNKTRKVSQLVHNLMYYSEINSQNNSIEVVDCSTALDTALKNLAALIEMKEAVINRSSLPKLKIDDTQLTQVFSILIDNAIRYNESTPPTISISAEHQGNEWLFLIKDNGIGVASEDIEKIFVFFRNNDNNTGLGLTIAKRIIERLGGRIWVESEPKAGSRFHFTLPTGQQP